MEPEALATPAPGDQPGRPRITLWGVGTSRTLRAHWALAELNLSYHTERVRTRTGDTETTEFTHINPRQKIPVLRDGDVTIAESAAIVTHLGEHHPHPEAPLVPTDPAQRARYFEWMFFACTELDATSLYVLRRHEYLPEIYGEAPVAVESSKAYFDRMAASAGVLFGEQEGYVLGEDFSGADIVLTTILEWAVKYGMKLPDNLEAYRIRVIGRAGYTAGLDANRA